MKKLIKIAASIGMIGFIFWACQKSQNRSKSSILTNPQAILIEEAKNYFNVNVKWKGRNMDAIINDAHPKLNLIRDLIKQALWDNAWVYKGKSTDVVVVPVHFQDLLYASLKSFQRERFSNNLLSRLLVYKDLSGNYQSEVITIFPDSNYATHSERFSGIAIIQKWDGSYLKGLKFSDHDIFNILILDSMSTGNVQSNSVNPNLRPVVTCDEIDWYSCTGTQENPYQNCTYSFTQQLGCTTTYVDDGGGGGGPSSIREIEYGYISSGQTSPPPTTNPWVASNNLCGSYAMIKTSISMGAQWKATINNLGAWFTHPLKGAFKAWWPVGCLTIPGWAYGSAYAASTALNSAFNSAVLTVKLELNAGQIDPTQIQLELKRWLNIKLNSIATGANFGTGAPCNPAAPVTNADDDAHKCADI
jgi:hypothetical protein